MSTHPRERIADWKNQEGYTHAATLASDLTYENARERMRSEATQRGGLVTPLQARSPGRICSVYRVWPAL